MEQKRLNAESLGQSDSLLEKSNLHGIIDPLFNVILLQRLAQVKYEVRSQFV